MTCTCLNADDCCPACTALASPTLRCPECHEPAVRLPRPLPRTGWALDVEPARLEHAHLDGEPLCPVMVSSTPDTALLLVDMDKGMALVRKPGRRGGYQPALPEEVR